jgi:thiamine kinase-like enzyme
VLDRLALLAGRPRSVAALPGGLTNRNYRVRAPGGLDLADVDAVVRIDLGQSAQLGIDRANEHANTVAAHEAGVGPPVLGYLPGQGVLVVGWIEGRTLSEDDLRGGEPLGRVADACRRLHAGPRFRDDFDMFVLQHRYRESVRAHGYRLPPAYDDFAGHLDRASSAMAERPEGTVPCHNDLLAANLIDDGERIWIIDYEYSGNNDACFELGNVAFEAGLTSAQLTALVTAYYGRPRVSRLARAELWGLVAQYGWSLWASIQDGVGAMDFDFWSWGMAKYDRAVAGFTSPHFDDLLDAVRAPD